MENLKKYSHDNPNTNHPSPRSIHLLCAVGRKQRQRSMNNVKIFAQTIETEAKEQIQRLAMSEAYRHCKIRIMPDCHAGKGCTIGTVIQIDGRVIPNTVGVDIGCGMQVYVLGKKNINLSLLDRIINEEIPSGFNVREKAVDDFAAELGNQLIIPLNMRDGSLICIGKGNLDWLRSAPHGAGRLMSRSKAKKMLSMSEYEKQMSGVYSSSVCEETIDESPMAYKSADEIISLIGDTVKIVRRIRPIYNFKAKE